MKPVKPKKLMSKKAYKKKYDNCKKWNFFDTNPPPLSYFWIISSVRHVRQMAQNSKSMH